MDSWIMMKQVRPSELYGKVNSKVDLNNIMWAHSKPQGL